MEAEKSNKIEKNGTDSNISSKIENEKNSSEISVNKIKKSNSPEENHSKPETNVSNSIINY